MTLKDIAEQVHAKAEEEAVQLGVKCITITIDETGAYQTRVTHCLNINTVVGVLSRATVGWIISKNQESIRDDR